MMTGRQSGDSPANLLEEPGQDIQARIRHLEEWVCALLIKNQTLRMELKSEEPLAGTLHFTGSSWAVTDMAHDPGLRSLEF